MDASCFRRNHRERGFKQGVGPGTTAWTHVHDTTTVSTIPKKKKKVISTPVAGLNPRRATHSHSLVRTAHTMVLVPWKGKSVFIVIDDKVCGD